MASHTKFSSAANEFLTKMYSTYGTKLKISEEQFRQDGMGSFSQVMENVSKSPDKKAAKPRKSKKDKDANAPKKPLSAYMFFVQKNRASIVAANPTLGFKEIGSAMGEAWRNCENKDPYHKMAEQAKLAYETNKVASVPFTATPATNEHHELKEQRCTYQYSKGVKKGDLCGKAVANGTLCTAHSGGNKKVKPVDSHPKKEVATVLSNPVTTKYGNIGFKHNNKMYVFATKTQPDTTAVFGTEGKGGKISALTAEDKAVLDELECAYA